MLGNFEFKNGYVLKEASRVKDITVNLRTCMIYKDEEVIGQVDIEMPNNNQVVFKNFDLFPCMASLRNELVNTIFEELGGKACVELKDSRVEEFFKED